MARLHFSALSDRGIRSINNDAFCAEKIGNYHVFGVAEGQPDPAHEEDASDIAVSSLRESVKNQKNSPAAALAAAVHESDTRISEHAANSPDGIRDMTHLSACLIDDSLKCTILDTVKGMLILSALTASMSLGNTHCPVNRKDLVFLRGAIAVIRGGEI